MKKTYNIHEVEYLTEIAFIIGEHKIKDIMTEMETNRLLTLDYEDFTNFCIYILREAESMDKTIPLLDLINNLIWTKYRTIRMYQQFLDQYPTN